MKTFPLFAIKVYSVEETSEATAETCLLLKNDPIIPGIIGIDGEFWNHSLSYCKWKSRGNDDIDNSDYVDNINLEYRLSEHFYQCEINHIYIL